MVSEVGLKKNIEYHLTITIKNSLINLIKMENYVQQIEGTSLIKCGSYVIGLAFQLIKTYRCVYIYKILFPIKCINVLT
jgi:hypothetical protein